MSVLICGSLAFDTITTFPGRFAQQILPEQVHILNVSFLVPSMRKEFGGCAGNIAYSLKQLGGEPLIMATLGKDGALYRNHLEQQGLNLKHVLTVEDDYTAQAIIITDQDNNQITAFHPGAMGQAHRLEIKADPSVKLAIVAPDGRDAMLQHAEQFAAADIPFVFDPGQGLPMFNGEELLHCLQLADYCAVNDYEARLLCERTGRSIESLAGEVGALIVTKGGEGSEIHANGRKFDIPCAQPTALEDPTGCGDAYRAGLLYGIEHGMDWEQTGRLASVMGAIKIANRGGQNHAPSRDEIGDAYRAAFGTRLW